jgi:hypothetical protein
MDTPLAVPRLAPALQPLRIAPPDLRFMAGAWMGVALALPVFTAVMLGATVAVMDAMSRAAAE